MNTAKTFILQEVVDELVNSDKSLVFPLLKLQYFSLLIKNEELLSFVTKEIEGYDKKKDDIPAYRTSIATLQVDIQAGYNEHSVEVPIAMLDESLRNFMQYLKINDGIAVLEQMAKDFNSDSKNAQYIILPLPMQMLPHIQPAVVKLYKSDAYLSAKAARLMTSKNKVIQVINTVRSRLLKFCMEIGEEFGFDIKIDSFKKKEVENNQVVYNIMKTQVTNIGDGNITNTGDEALLESFIALKKQ